MWPGGPYIRRDPRRVSLRLLLAVVTWTRSKGRVGAPRQRGAARRGRQAAWWRAWGATLKPATHGVEASGIAFEYFGLVRSRRGRRRKPAAARSTCFREARGIEKRREGNDAFPHLHGAAPEEVGEDGGRHVAA